MRMHRRQVIPVGCVLAGLVLGVGVAYAVPRIGPNDVETLFYIAKSDDRNRVDYGVHLDATCVPVGRDPVFAYWRRFEPGAERFGDLNLLDQTVYGIEHQDVATRDGTGTWIRVQLRALSSRTLHVRIQRGQDGCTGVVLLEILGKTRSSVMCSSSSRARSPSIAW
jgi:hypothetical protein